MTEPDLTNVRIAVLIDADNISFKHAEAVLEELASYGTTTIKRAYGDWTSPRLGGWKAELNRLAIKPQQQFAYTVGKNATDTALIIDAMDLLWMGNVEAFALVSSDSDFTTLATRLRESGKRVYGIGRRRTPQSLQKAVDQFIYLELLGAGEAVEESPGGPVALDDATPAPAGTASVEPAEPVEPVEPVDETAPPAPSINLESALTKAVNATSDDEGWATLSAIGQHLRRAHPAFDPREFGHAKLSTLVAEQGYLRTEKAGGGMRVRLKGRRGPRKTAATTAESPR